MPRNVSPVSEVVSGLLFPIYIFSRSKTPILSKRWTYLLVEFRGIKNTLTTFHYSAKPLNQFQPNVAESTLDGILLKCSSLEPAQEH